jgi:transposase
MRGHDTKQATMFSVVSPEHRVPQDHPLRPIKAMADDVLASMSRTFGRMYSKVGRPSIPPERLLKAQILIALYSVRSDRMFCEQLDYNLLFRWFLDMNMDEPAFDHSSFTKNRDRLLQHDVAAEFFAAVVERARQLGLMSSEHFTVDGTLIEAWASLKSFRPKDEKPEDRDPPDDPGNPTVNFHGEKRSNETHASTTDPEARLARKGNNQEAKLCFSAHALMENRNGLLVDLRIDHATGTAERESALALLAENVEVTGATGAATRATTSAPSSTAAASSGSRRTSPRR